MRTFTPSSHPTHYFSQLSVRDFSSKKILLDNASLKEINASWEVILNNTGPIFLTTYLFPRSKNNITKEDLRIKTDLLKKLLPLDGAQYFFPDFLQYTNMPIFDYMKEYNETEIDNIHAEDELLDATLKLHGSSWNIFFNRIHLEWLHLHSQTLIDNGFAHMLLKGPIEDILYERHEYTPSYAAVVTNLIEKAQNKGIYLPNVALDLDSYIPLKRLQEAAPLLIKHISLTYFLTLLFRLDSVAVDDMIKSYVFDSEKVEVRENLMKLALQNEKDVDFFAFIRSGYNTKILHYLLENDYFDLVKDLKEEDTTSSTFLSLLRHNFDFTYITKILDHFPHLYDEKSLFRILRDEGKSHMVIDILLKICMLAHDYIKTDHYEQPLLSEEEIALLDPSSYMPDLPSDANFTNKYNFSPIELSFITGKASLLVDMDKGNTDPTDINILMLACFLSKIFPYANSVIFLDKFIEKSLDRLDDIDILLNEHGESVVDVLPHRFYETFVNKTQNPLYYFLKENASVILPSHSPEETAIAISASHDAWSIGLQSTARLVMQQYPDVQFYFVPLSVLKKANTSFFDQFDGWINPGAGDNYPRDRTNFTLDDFELSINVDFLYQAALNGTFLHNIPSWGICAGAQHLSLYHKGSLTFLPQPHHGSGHVMHFFEDTLPYFMSLSVAQQKNLLQYCSAPEVKFPADTAHSYAAVPDKLGNNLQLGAVSEGYLAMAYAYNNGLHYGIQFHPEHEYHKIPKGDIVNHAKMFFDNFIRLAIMHHDCKTKGGMDPIEFFAAV